MSARMSETLHAVVRGPSLTGCGALPAFTIAHHVLFETGNTWRTAGRRMNPMLGMSFGVTIAYPCFGYSLIRFWILVLISWRLITTIRLYPELIKLTQCAA